MRPALLVIAGPNGAGKTTITGRLRAERWSEGVEYLNPDDIARDRFGDWNSPEAVMNAARWTEARREELLSEGRGIAFETVFSAPDKLDFLKRARNVVHVLAGQPQAATQLRPIEIDNLQPRYPQSSATSRSRQRTSSTR